MRPGYCVVWPLASLLTIAGCVSSVRKDARLDQIVDRVRLLQSTDRDESTKGIDALRAAAADAFATREPARVSAAVQSWLDAASLETEGTADLLQAIEAAVWLADRTERRVSTLPADRRSQWATAAVDASTVCLRRAPESDSCAYRLAISLGVQARERTSTGLDALPRMVSLLEGIAETSKNLDQGGPNRVLAWVRLRAPAWPTGPGDLDLALEHAEAACAEAPDYPPNQLVRAAVLAELGETSEAEIGYRRVREAAKTAHPDRPDWLREADDGLGSLGVSRE